MATPVLESSDYASAAASSVAAVEPTGTSSTDDVAVMFLSVGTSAQSHSMGAGTFTQVGTTYQRSVGGGNHIGVSWWVSNTDVSGDGTWSFSASGGTVGQCLAASYRVSGSTGHDATAGAGLIDSFALSGTTVTMPSITTSDDECLAIGALSGTSLSAHPSGWTLQDSDATIYRYYKAMPTAGATGTDTATTSANGIYARGVLAFLPGAGGASIEGIAASTGGAGTGTASGVPTTLGAAASTGGAATSTAAAVRGVAGVAASTGAAGTGAAIGAGSAGVTGTAASTGGTGTGTASGVPTTLGIAASTAGGGSGTVSAVRTTFGAASSAGLAGTGWAEGSTTPGGGEPAAPTEVRPTGAFGFDLEVELTWTVPDDNGSTITGYVVHVSTDDGDNWTPHATPSSTPATLTGLTANQRYLFRVAAVNANGTGPFGVSEWGCTPVLPAAAITPPTESTRDASAGGRWGLDEVDGDTDNTATSTWTGAGVRVYIVDSNFRLTHDEFDGQAFSEGYAIDGLTLGSLAYGEDHGTEIASSAVGATCGLAFDAIMIPIASHNQSLDTPIYNFVESLQWVYDNHPADTPGILITSNLWGDDNDAEGFTDTDGRHTDEWFPLVDALCTDLIEDKSLAFVQCIGNSNSTPHIDLDARPGLVLVSYSNEDDEYASGSEFTPDTTIIAPGAAVLVAQSTNDSGLITKSGTSFAAPLTGGAMACWLEANPALSPRQLVDILLATSLKNALSGENSGAPNRELRALADIGAFVAAGAATSTGAAGTGTVSGIRTTAGTATSTGSTGTGTVSAVRTVTGTATSTGAAGSGTAAGTTNTPLVTGTATSTGAPGTGTAAGAPTTLATAASTGGAGTGTASGLVTVTGTATSTGGTGTGTASAVGSTTGTASSTGSPGAGAAAGVRSTFGTAASVGGVGLGSARDGNAGVVTGTATSTGAASPGTASGLVTVTATAASTGSASTGSSTGVRRIIAAASSTAGPGTASTSGVRRCHGTASSTGAAGSGFCAARRTTFGTATSTGPAGTGTVSTLSAGVGYAVSITGITRRHHVLGVTRTHQIVDVRRGP